MYDSPMQSSKSRTKSAPTNPNEMDAVKDLTNPE